MEENLRSEELLKLFRLNVSTIEHDKLQVRSRLDQKPGALAIVTEIMEQAREISKSNISFTTSKHDNEEESLLTNLLEVTGQELSEKARDQIVKLIDAYKLEVKALSYVEQTTLQRALNLFEGKFVNLKAEELEEKLQVIKNVFEDLKSNLKDELIGTANILQQQRKRIISKGSKEILEKWYSEHQLQPYATNEEKELLAQQTSLSPQQVNVWISNKRNRARKKERLLDTNI